MSETANAKSWSHGKAWFVLNGMQCSGLESRFQWGLAGGKLGRLLWPCFPARSGPFFPLSSSFIPGQRPEVIERKAFLRALRIRGQVSSKAEVAGVKNKCRVCVYVCVCVGCVCVCV